jgi:hypothetical protein
MEIFHSHKLYMQSYLIYYSQGNSKRMWNYRAPHALIWTQQINYRLDGLYSSDTESGEKCNWADRWSLIPCLATKHCDNGNISVGAVGCGITLQAGRPWNSHDQVLGTNQPLTEMGTRNIPGGKERPVER